MERSNFDIREFAVSNSDRKALSDDDNKTSTDKHEWSSRRPKNCHRQIQGTVKSNKRLVQLIGQMSRVDTRQILVPIPHTLERQLSNCVNGPLSVSIIVLAEKMLSQIREETESVIIDMTDWRENLENGDVIK